MKTSDTLLVFYMCIQKLDYIFDKLIMNKKNIYTDKLVEKAEKPANILYILCKRCIKVLLIIVKS
ncbi:hypothetical protein [Blattabacterium cuenoti]|uniref:hypothetical protein n=1 Tax=Blattabacterium cuenoti TaxID=1653831 RepID=UPI00163C4DA9|nr:hypothetical protein [Blattabacterium cuenoti]